MYDGDGRRVQKLSCPVGTSACTPSVGGATVSSTYVYDASGGLAAEYSTQPAVSPCTTCYLTADHLGSTRMMTDGSGTVKSLLDYLPFGEEIPAGVGGRSAWPYPPNPLAINDGTAQKFTGKERDTETGLDYFGARYLSSAQGRFTSPDWSEKPEPVPYAELSDPQSLNLYIYVSNRPLSRRDTDGHFWEELKNLASGNGWTKDPPPPPPPPPPPAIPAPVNPVYPTADKALVAAARVDQQKQQQTGAEHASSAYTIGPAYTYTNPVTQGQRTQVDPNNTTGVPTIHVVDLSKAPIPPGTQLVGEAHSHPDEIGFSGRDIQRSHDMTIKYFGHPLYQGFYVGLPSGTVLKYDPFTGKETTFLPGAPR